MVLIIFGLPGSSVVKNLPATQETHVQSLGLEDSLEKEMQPILVFLSGKSHGHSAISYKVSYITF